MMSCTEIRELLVEHLDTERPEVTEHLSGCAECRAYFEPSTSAVETLRAAPDLDPPAGGWERLAASLDRPTPRRNGFGWVAAAAAILLAVAGFFLFQETPPPKNFDIEVVDAAEQEGLDTFLSTHADSSPLVTMSPEEVARGWENE